VAYLLVLGGHSGPIEPDGQFSCFDLLLFYGRFQTFLSFRRVTFILLWTNFVTVLLDGLLSFRSSFFPGEVKFGVIRASFVASFFLSALLETYHPSLPPP